MFNVEKLWTSTQLPTLPGVAIKLIELSRNPETEVKEIVELVKTDPAICAKILKSTNSSFFGFTSQISSIDRAIPLLGTTVVTSLALSFSLASDSVNTGPLQPYYKGYWKQSIIHAVAGESLGKISGNGLECEFFLAGILMDIGRLALLKAAPREYFPVLMTAESQNRQLQEVEQEFLKIDHAHVSYKLMESWGLPAVLRKGVQLQHENEEVVLAQINMPEDKLAAAMVLSNAIGDYFLSATPGIALKRTRLFAEKFFDMDEEAVSIFLESLSSRIESAGELFNVDMSDIGDPGDLMAQASQQLLQLTMQSQLEKQQLSQQKKRTEEENAELETKNIELQKKATRDPLTGIYNRAFFDDAINKATRSACERCQPLGVIFTDIDKFKLLNDNYGHQFGDEVLKRVATVVARNLRSSDVLARFGGEEFVILVSKPTEKGMQKLAERIRSALEATEFYCGTTLVSVTASFGAAVIMPGRLNDDYAEKVIQQADEAMYDSKKNGRNQVHMRSLFSDLDRQRTKQINQSKFSRWIVGKELLDVPSISRALLQVAEVEQQVGEQAVELGIMSSANIDAILHQQKISQNRFGEVAIELGYLAPAQLVQLIAWQSEPPEQLRDAIVHCGYFSADRTQLLLDEYLETTSIKQPAKLSP